MSAIQANLSSVRVKKTGAKYLRHNGEKVVEVERPSTIVNNSMFPYKSVQMACEPEDI
jgi:hypothetical protein